MSRSFSVIGTAIISFGLGYFVARTMAVPGAEEDEAAWELEIPAAAAKLWFPPADQYDNDGEQLSDESFEELMAALRTAMTAEETLADFEREADIHLWNFIRRLRVPRISDDQLERIKAYLDVLAEEHPDSRVIRQKKSILDGYARPGSSIPSFAGFITLFPYDEANYPEAGEPFEDWQVDRMLAELDALLNLPESTGDFEAEASIPLWEMGYTLQRRIVSGDQTARVVAYLEGLKEKYPDAVEMLDRQRFVVENLMPGQVAPNIVGKDTEGVEFELEDYRGNIVVLVFSGQWCGPCRAEYPYQRAMLEAFRDKDVVLLSVNSDAKLETIRQAKIDEALDYRTWWDGHSQPEAEAMATGGPIATRWRVLGWPTIYVIDEEGVIRQADADGGGSLVATVDELLQEKTMRE